ncbi:uncharacterized protein BO66DRAFT_440268 [Aspergillus aculeatinus CBS 121060]|uniref:Uncharacterized protein n=1 Tax=Aspergillus aculeatinus CBS 121060 TaxID=1448322 RepID=A0ACD1H3M6_9EURO|nr:hypothetical protein BO66DRAFT_440268 [Aspergillus aculeatinus CBS 121060]RAH68341.1 hypothetical protein BO66DRAFT_440268 [Aspergillus aculeatinus CBS 121060]
MLKSGEFSNVGDGMPRSSILNLPPEILSQILGLILGRISFERRLGILRSGTGIIALLLTCQQFYRLTVPLLYHELEFCYPSGRRTNCLYRSLQSDPSLLLPVRSLVLVLQRDRTKTCISLEDYAAAANVLSLFCGAKVYTLRIQGEVVWSPEDQERLQSQLEPGQSIGNGQWELLQHALRHLPALRRVELMGVINEPRDGFGGRFECQLQGYAELRALPGTDPTTPSAIRREAHEGCAALQVRLSPSIGPDIILFLFAPPFLLSFLDDAAYGLVEFSLAFDELLKNGIPHTPATVKVFYPWLQAHPHTLRRMVFGAIPFYALGLEFRASTFPNLHTVVCLPFHVMSETHPRVYWRPAAAIDQLLSPTVRTFVWDLISYGDFWGPGLLGFDEPQARWLLAFAEGALAGKGQALRTIRIEFVPYIDWLGYVDPDDYPWDRMEQLKQKMRVLGIALEYNTPTLTREEYSRSCKEVRQLVESGQLPPMVDRV